MSVAFRRDNDEEHKEPRFERPIPAGANLVTPRGLRQIEQQVATHEALVAPDEHAQRELRYWRQRLATARLAPPPPEDEAALGSRVRFRQDGQVRSVDIVGEDEAEPTAGRIAASAPLARALIGAGAGDRIDFAGRSETLEVIETRAIPDA